MRIIIDRAYPKPDYIIGNMSVDGQWLCSTLEPPWKDNARNVSCIPSGIYEVRLAYSAKFNGVRPLLVNVPGRSSILIHEGNTRRDTEGCILVGLNTAKGKVLQSRKTLSKLLALMEKAKARKEMITIIVEERQ